MAPKKFKIVAIGTGDPGKPPILTGFLKTYAESRPGLKGRIDFRVVVIGNYRDAFDAVNPLSPDLVVLSPHEDWDNKEMFALCGRLRKANPRLSIATCAETPRNRIRLTEAFSGGLVDYVVHGESEAPLSDLISHMVHGDTRLEDVRGIIWKKGSRIVTNQPHPGIKNLDEIPSPYLEGVFDLKSYKSAELALSRGCRWKCRYCAINEGALRCFSYERVKAELEALLKQAPRLEEISLMIFDMFDNQAVAAPLLSLFRKAAVKRGIRFQFDVNINSLNKPDLLKLVDDPRFCIEVGIQSSYSGALSAAGRPMTPGLLDKHISLLRRHAPRASVSLSFIRGLPGDTAATYRDTLDWAVSTGYGVMVNHLRILPGTGFDRDRAAHGIKTYAVYPYFVRATNTFPGKDIREAAGLTDRVGFVMKLAAGSPRLLGDLLEAGRELEGSVPHPYITLAEGFCGHLKGSRAFSAMFRGYMEGRRESASMDWSSDTSDFGNIREEDLLKEFVSFRARVMEKLRGKCAAA
ncbi:MAG: radical SAM domain-containing protein [Elusimicrobia bacterium]|nr:MAG: radical SAM domain-containing protein [Elusimicrobiota bacterium]KAF0155344.1 MAG: radical SAM domain-containing protein [Elusimicrobiota bacterium]